ncbi:MAG: hypothetical protein J0H46_11580 [Bacteroidetes bacterium]|nr:hypothetical protein [Bacteroidota bacterium]
MGYFLRTVNSRAPHSKNIFATYYEKLVATVTHLPFVLNEAMVNHKKMVHPPCTL